MASVRSHLASVLLLVSAAAIASGQSFAFHEVGAQKGLGEHLPEVGMGSGAAAADADNDGDIDLFVPQRTGVPDKVYRNMGGWFQEVGAAAGLDSTIGSRVAVWVDYDGDKDLDLFVANDTVIGGSSFRLYRQDPGFLFSDVTTEAGLAVDARSFSNNRGGICAGDINGDGWIDLYCANWGGPQTLFRNNGPDLNGTVTFTDITHNAGLDCTGCDAQWQVMMHDFTGDGRPDIYVSMDFTENLLWENQGNETFVDVAGAWNCQILMNDMGMYIADFDKDGDFDAYTTNIFEHRPGDHNVLLRNNEVGGVRRFADVSASQGVNNGGWGWGNTFFDADNDRDQDLVATNGVGSYIDTTRFWMHNGNSSGRMYSNDLAAAVGLDDNCWGSCILAVDHDRDGDQDLVHVTMDHGVRLLENRPADPGPAQHVFGRKLPPGNRSLVVQPRMPGPNSRALCSVVRARIGNDRQARLISAGCSCWGQEPAEAHFGTGMAPLVHEVRVEFPDQTVTVLENVEPGGIIEVAPMPFTDLRIRRGQKVMGGILYVLESDDERLVVEPADGQNMTMIQVGLHTAFSPSAALDLHIESSASVGGVSGTAWAYNWPADRWEYVKTWPVTGADHEMVLPDLPASRFVRPSDGRVELRLRQKRGLVARGDVDFRSRYDAVHVEVR